MYEDQLADMTYREFLNAVATARSKVKMRVSLSAEERYLLKHQTSIELLILQKEEEYRFGVPTEARGLSDDIRDPSFLAASWADRGTGRDTLPSKKVMKLKKRAS